MDDSQKKILLGCGGISCFALMCGGLFTMGAVFYATSGDKVAAKPKGMIHIQPTIGRPIQVSSHEATRINKILASNLTLDCTRKTYSSTTREHCKSKYKLDNAIKNSQNRVSKARFENLYVTGSYFIDKHEVTVKDYKLCLASKKCTEEPKSDQKGQDHACNFGNKYNQDHPVNCITKKGAFEYCASLGKRLPTHGEWLRASRGPKDDRIYPWGNDSLTCKKANIRERKADGSYGTNGCGSSKTAGISKYPGDKSPYGVYGLAGNVKEMTISKSDIHKKLHSDLATYRMRQYGGSWASHDQGEYISILYEKMDKRTKSTVLGFRCAKSAE